MGCWIYYLSSNVVGLFPLLQFLTLSRSPLSEATTSPNVPHVKPSYSFGRTFLGLDKCNACIGTSICKKFFKEEIRFDSWLSPRLKLPPSYLLSYSGNYTDDAKSWRLVDITRLTTKYQHDQADKRICTSVSNTKACSIERVLRKTERFQKWLKAKRLTPDLIQIFPDVEGWPFPRYLGSCGRLIVSASTRPLTEFYSSSPDVAADLAFQLLSVVNSMGNNDLNYLFYFVRVDAGTFGIFNNGHLFIRDASTLGIIDKQEGSQLIDGQQEYRDIFSCLASDCQSTFLSCKTVRENQNFIMVCQEILPKLLKGKFLQPVQEKIDSFLRLCANSFLDSQEVNDAATKLAEFLRPLRSCDSRFAYRYPDCKYNDKY
ncbi:deleted in autism-related protein 1 isoform X2 [Alligator sinensis]|uniref:Deleted in autism-related protein 1 isoform X2 n=1 Tax=Alligator sinensis TaxID=38654 RepID=A0A3Q0FND2_ALLSI|nr:deleted in autism-related protein 1 isoform X2 [Alligator sinensis]